MFEFVELLDESVGIIGTAIRVFCEQSVDDIITQIDRHVLRQWRRWRLHVHENRRQKSFLFEGRATGEHFIENDAERIEIAARVEFLATSLLGTHIFGRSRSRAHFR